MTLECTIPDCSASATSNWPDLHMRREQRASENEIVLTIGDETVKVKAKDLRDAVERLQ